MLALHGNSPQGRGGGIGSGVFSLAHCASFPVRLKKNFVACHLNSWLWMDLLFWGEERRCWHILFFFSKKVGLGDVSSQVVGCLSVCVLLKAILHGSSVLNSI